MAPSEAFNNALGAVGGAVLAACLAPQLLKLWKTRSARDLSYLFLILYNLGLVLTFVYMYYEGAVVGYICILVEVGFGVTMLAAKTVLDTWGPYGTRRQQGKAGLGDEIRIEALDFAAGHSAPFPLLRPSPTHAAQHLLVEARLAMPGTALAAEASAAAQAAPKVAPSAGSKGGVSGDGSKHEGPREVVCITADGSAHGGRAGLAAMAAAEAAQRQAGAVLETVQEMVESSLAAAGLPVLRRQVQAFPSFGRGQAQADVAEGDVEAGCEGEAPHLVFVACRDGYATAILHPGPASLSIDLLAASDEALAGMGRAAREVVHRLQAAWPGTRIAGASVARLPLA